jgi:hypothetical protein
VISILSGIGGSCYYFLAPDARDQLELPLIIVSYFRLSFFVE